MKRSFERSLGFLSVFSISVGAMISGLFVLPGLAAAKTGTSVILAFFLAGLIALPAALSKAELATAIPTSGGTYIYLDRSMGPFIGTIGGIGTWLSLLFKSAFALVGLGAYLAILLPLPTKYVALVFCVGLMAINIAGVKKTAKLQIGIVICVLAALDVLIGKDFTRLHGEFYAPFTNHGWMGVISATGFVFISYAGVTKIASIAEEVKNPERNIPLGIIVSLVMMIFIYVLVVFAIVGTVPLADLGTDLTPIATSARAVFGTVGERIWSIVAIFALVSMANAGILSASRFPFAMSRDRIMPDFLKSVHPKLRTPYPSILLTGGLMLLLITFVDVENLAKLASAFQILVYSLENLSLIIFQESDAEWYRPTFRSPLYPWMQLVGIAALLILLLKLGSLSMIGVSGIFVFGAIWYFLYARNRIDRTGALAQTQRRIELLQESSDAAHGGDGNRNILVAFFGNEGESEIADRMRVSLLFSLPDGVAHPVHFDEAPDQTILETLRDLEEEAFFAKFQRATRQWADQLTLESIATHDAKLALFHHAREIEAKWIILGWQKKSIWDFLIKAHRYWWLHHAPCNVAQLINRGLENVRRIAVMAEPGPYDALLVHIADRLSMEPDVEVFCLHVADENASNADIESVRAYHKHLAQLSARNMESRIIRAKKRLERILIETKDCDLLIIGAPAEHSLAQAFSMSFEDKIGERAACSVFKIQSPRFYSHEVTSSVPTAIREGGFRLSQFLNAGAVEVGIDIRDKASLFRHISATLEANSGIASADVIEQAFWKREQIQNTAIGNGIAIPHAVIDRANSTFFGIFTLENTIDFLAPDGAEVDVCFITVGPIDQRDVHLKIIARIARLVRETDLLTSLREAKDPSELIEAITSLDREEPL